MVLVFWACEGRVSGCGGDVLMAALAAGCVRLRSGPAFLPYVVPAGTQGLYTVSEPEGV